MYSDYYLSKFLYRAEFNGITIILTTYRPKTESVYFKIGWFWGFPVTCCPIFNNIIHFKVTSRDTPLLIRNTLKKVLYNCCVHAAANCLIYSLFYCHVRFNLLSLTQLLTGRHLVENLKNFGSANVAVVTLNEVICNLRCSYRVYTKRGMIFISSQSCFILTL